MHKKIKKLRGFSKDIQSSCYDGKFPQCFPPTQTTTCFPLVFSIHAMKHKLYISEEIIYNANHSQVKLNTEDITFAARYEHNQYNLQNNNFAFFCKNLRFSPPQKTQQMQAVLFGCWSTSLAVPTCGHRLSFRGGKTGSKLMNPKWRKRQYHGSDRFTIVIVSWVISPT